MPRRPSRYKSRPRFGFTLIELMVVIVIIGILIALLLPAIVGAVRKANDARVSGDIQTIASSLARFKDTYGEFPPSRVILSEQGCYSEDNYSATPSGQFILPDSTDRTTALGGVNSSHWLGSVSTAQFGSPDISIGTLADRSLRAIRKFFPRVAAPNSTVWHDFNGNNSLDPGFIYLEGHECLVFFLGGIPNPTSNADGTIGYGTAGFGRDPRFPFTPSIIPNRTQALYEFKGNRLYDDDGDGIPGYFDSLATGNQGRFLTYFVSYGASGYDPNDDNKPSPDESDTPGLSFRVGNPVLGSGSNNTTVSPAPNPYTTSLPTPINATATPTFNLSQPAAYMNQNSFQIISAGGDRQFGPGGQYSPSGDKLPLPPISLFGLPSGIRVREYDNVTNFSTGRLN